MCIKHMSIMYIHVHIYAYITYLYIYVTMSRSNTFAYIQAYTIMFNMHSIFSRMTTLTHVFALPADLVHRNMS